MKLVIVAVALAAAFPAAAHADTSHKGWPKFDTKPWINKTDRVTTHHGSTKNDEILGGHRDDTLFGEGGRDVLWGDYKPSGQTTAQHDQIWGGPGRDHIYASHGRNAIRAGGGNDWIKAHFGRGLVNCGGGNDLLYVSRRAQKGYKIRNCERISHKTLGR